MSLPKRLSSLSIVLVGVLGVALCVAIGVVVWRVAARVSQANDRVFDVIDTALVAGRDRILEARQRVEDAKITADDVSQGVEAWARREIPQRVASRPAVEKTIERLRAGLDRAGRGLEISGSSLQVAQQALAFAHSLDAPVDVALVDPLLDALNALRGRVSQSMETVDAIGSRIQEIGNGETLEERLSRLAQVTLRVVATLTEVDSRLGDSAEGLDAARTRAHDAKARIARYILFAEIGAFVLIAWMAVGQIALARYGWTKLRPQP